MTQALVSMVITLTAIALLAVMSLRANRRFGTEPRLPMQWLLDGTVTWTAPRAVALAFLPVVAGLCLAAIAALATFLPPRPGQEGLVIPVNIFAALVFVGVHALHLRLMQRTLKRQG